MIPAISFTSVSPKPSCNPPNQPLFPSPYDIRILSLPLLIDRTGICLRIRLLYGWLLDRSPDESFTKPQRNQILEPFFLVMSREVLRHRVLAKHKEADHISLFSSCCMTQCLPASFKGTFGPIWSTPSAPVMHSQPSRRLAPQAVGEIRLVRSEPLDAAEKSIV